MNILLAAQTIPNTPSKDGLTLILYHLVNYLNQHHTTTVLARDQFDDATAFMAAVEAARDQHDVLYLHGPEVLSLLPQLSNYQRCIAGLIDVPSYKYQQLIEHETSTWQKRRWLKQQRQWEQFEHAELAKLSYVVVGSSADYHALRKQVSAQPPFIQVIANGVDSEYFTPDPNTPKEAAVIFSGMMDQPSHVQSIIAFAKHVWPSLRQDKKLRWYIVGRDPDKKILDLAKPDAQLIVTGFVPEVRDFLRQSQIFVSPLHLRSGIRNTVLEAMACALPVVAFGDACTGLEASPIQKVTTDLDFANTVRKLLSDTAMYDRVSQASRKYVVQHHLWSAQCQQYEKVLVQASHS